MVFSLFCHTVSIFENKYVVCGPGFGSKKNDVSKHQRKYPILY